MSEEEKKKKRVLRRLPPPVTIGLKKLKRTADDEEEKFKEWVQDRCDELGFYVDQVNFETGAVVDPIKGDRVIKRLELKDRQKEILTEARQMFRDIREARKIFNRRLADVSLEYGIPTKGLNLETGEIVDEVVVQEVKTLEEQEKESKAKAEEAAKAKDKVAQLFQDEDSEEKEEA